MDTLQKIVLTGGPCGGKSTAIRRLRDVGAQAMFVPEVATILFSGGYPAPDERNKWSYEWQRTFQSAVSMTQISIEDELGRRAKECGATALILDRGLLDGASYLQGGVRELESMTGMSEQEMLERYDAVLHLPTGALLEGEQYDTTSNPHRFEEAEEAIRLDGRIVKAWKNHPNRHTVDRQCVVDFVIGLLASQ
jgi:predicted ATPase